METTNTPDLDEALRLAQLEFPEIPKDKCNSHFNQRYSSLDAIVSVTRPSLAKNHLVAYHVPEDTEDGIRVTAVLRHTPSKQERTVSLSAICDRGRIQDMGSRITYLRRYTLGPLLGITPDEDDDGNAAAPTQRRNEPAQPQTPAKQPATTSKPPQPAKQPPVANAETEQRKAEMKGWPVDKVIQLVKAATDVGLLAWVVDAAEGGEAWLRVPDRECIFTAIREQLANLFTTLPANARNATVEEAFKAKMKQHVAKLELDKQLDATETTFEQEATADDTRH